MLGFPTQLADALVGERQRVREPAAVRVDLRRNDADWMADSA